jgi:hypothetical protein
MSEASQIAMPRYKSSKIVAALEIASVEGHTLTFVEAGYAPIEAPAEMFLRYTPVPGDRYMVYPDGYKSFSPKKAFEEGYERIS